MDVVSLCDVDKRCSPERPNWSPRGRFQKRSPAPTRDYREMLKEKDLDVVLIAHAGSLACAADDRGGAKRGGYLLPETDRRGCDGMPGDAGRRAETPARGANRHAAPQHAASDRGPRTRSSKPASWAKSRTWRSAATTTCARRTIRPTRRRRRISITKCGPALRRCGLTMRSSTRGAGAHSWNTATASSATCACTCSIWRAGCSTSAGRRRVSSSGGIFVDKASKANISDTQTATFEFDGVTSSGLTAPGATRPIQNILGRRPFTATRAR